MKIEIKKFLSALLIFSVLCGCFVFSVSAIEVGDACPQMTTKGPCGGVLTFTGYVDIGDDSQHVAEYHCTVCDYFTGNYEVHYYIKNVCVNCGYVSADHVHDYGNIMQNYRPQDWQKHTYTGICVCGSEMSFTVNHEYSNSPVCICGYINYDTNGDGSLTAEDVEKVSNLAYAGTYEVMCDFNRDNIVDIDDDSIIKAYFKSNGIDYGETEEPSSGNTTDYRASLDTVVTANETFTFGRTTSSTITNISDAFIIPENKPTLTLTGWVAVTGGVCRYYVVINNSLIFPDNSLAGVALSDAVKNNVSKSFPDIIDYDNNGRYKLTIDLSDYKGESVTVILGCESNLTHGYEFFRLTNIEVQSDETETETDNVYTSTDFLTGVNVIGGESNVYPSSVGFNQIVSVTDPVIVNDDDQITVQGWCALNGGIKEYLVSINGSSFVKTQNFFESVALDDETKLIIDNSTCDIEDYNSQARYRLVIDMSSHKDKVDNVIRIRAVGNTGQTVDVLTMTNVDYKVSLDMTYDMNGDGELDALDVRYMEKLVSNGTYSTAADFNEDGRVDLDDYMIITSYFDSMGIDYTDESGTETETDKPGKVPSKNDNDDEDDEESPLKLNFKAPFALVMIVALIAVLASLAKKPKKKTRK